jgi:predicted alpha/beta superfamily hydrolase
MKNSIAILFVAFAFLSFGQKNKSKQTTTETARPFVLGVIDEIQSKELGEKRVVNIYLPAGYDPKDSIKYPVIYLLDGSADEDFIHIAGLVQFNNFDWVNQVPKSIVVGIASVNRQRDFTFPSTHEDQKKGRFANTGHSDKFIAFIEKELQPFMASKYKANNDKTLIGQSLGGLLATDILLKKPEMFNRYIIISPSLWWDYGSLLEIDSPLLAEGYTQQTDVYIGVGKEGLTPTDPPRVMEVDANLLADKLKSANKENLKIVFDYLPLENHATIMHQAVMNAFRLLYTVPAE